MKATQIETARATGYRDGFAGRKKACKYTDYPRQIAYEIGYAEGQRTGTAMVVAAPGVKRFHDELLARMFTGKDAAIYEREGR